MKVSIIGAGRMGIRHAQGALKAMNITHIQLIDKNITALNNAKEALKNTTIPITYTLYDNFTPATSPTDVVIIATTATNRKELLLQAKETNCKAILLEKPLGQSVQEIKELHTLAKKIKAKVFVNLCMRLHEGFAQVKKDLATLPQFKGDKVITVNSGSVGIGANGIHYIDIAFFLLGANRAEFVAGEIENTLIPSGRGIDFGDFGGWCTLKYFNNNEYLGRLHISLTSQSSVFGSWDIVAPYGKISMDEVAEIRINHLRKDDSTLPIYRYAADYLPPEKVAFPAPFLGDFTTQWLNTLEKSVEILPTIEAALPAHDIMFQWLSLSKTHKEIFPIT